MQDTTSVAVLKFNTGQVASADLRAAILTLHVSEAGGGFNHFLVLGLPGAVTTSSYRHQASADSYVLAFEQGSKGLRVKPGVVRLHAA